MNARTFKTTGWLLGGVAALFLAAQFFDAGAFCKSRTGSAGAAHAELNASAGPDGPAPLLW